MRRREILGLLSVVVASPLAVQRAAWAQQSLRRPLIAFLASGGRRDFLRFYVGLIDGLKELGLIENRDFEFVVRYAEGDVGQLPVLAQELVRLNPDVIIASVTAAAVAAKRVSTAIPIIAAQVIDPIGFGLVESLSRPGGNVTGILASIDGLPGKQIELLREVAPTATRIGMLLNPTNAQNGVQAKDAHGAMEARGLQLAITEVRSSSELDPAFAELARKQVNGLLVPADPMLFLARKRVAALAAEARLPTMYSLREHVEDGGLMSYAVNRRDSFSRAAAFVDKILKGTPPANLPVELPRKLELVINLKTVHSLGLQVPNTLLVSADEVIE
jgi:putative ABC transport system substrate-binding protein